jgi:hypothetical protein
VKGAEVAEQFIKAAEPTHPSLLDPMHIVTELYNTRNVPTSIWIDEQGRIVRFDEGIYLFRRNRETGETSNNELLEGDADWVGRAEALFMRCQRRGAEQRCQPAAENAEAAVPSGWVPTSNSRRRRGRDCTSGGAHALQPDNYNTAAGFQPGQRRADYGTTMQQIRVILSAMHAGQPRCQA